MGPGGSEGRVVALWRYPVKSLGGEPCRSVSVDGTGVAGDRQWGLRDPATGLVLTARRVPELLFASSRLDGERALIRLPPGAGDGAEDAGEGAPGPDPVSTADPDAALRLSAWLGRPVEVAEAARAGPGTYETPVDSEDESGDWRTWSGPAGRFLDSDRTRVSIVSVATLAGWDVRRFRPNVVVDGIDEDGLVGSRVRIGAAELDVVKRIGRCVVTTRRQPGGIDRDVGVLRTVNRRRDGFLGVGALVAAAGVIAVGDPVRVTPGTPPA